MDAVQVMGMTAPTPMLPDYEYRPVALNAQGSYTSDTPWKLVLHTMEGFLAPSFRLFEDRGYSPHLAVSLDDDTYWPLNPLDKASSALQNLPGGTETNRDKVIQVEIEGVAKDTAYWDMAKYRKLVHRVLLPIIRAQPLIAPVVPFRFADGYSDANSATRLTAATWDASGGILGHCHVPENTHWDPGFLDRSLIQRMLDAALSEGEGMEVLIDTTTNEHWVTANGRADKLTEPAQWMATWVGKTSESMNMRYVVPSLYEVVG